MPLTICGEAFPLKLLSVPISVSDPFFWLSMEKLEEANKPYSFTHRGNPFGRRVHGWLYSNRGRALGLLRYATFHEDTSTMLDHTHKLCPENLVLARQQLTGIIPTEVAACTKLSTFMSEFCILLLRVSYVFAASLVIGRNSLMTGIVPTEIGLLSRLGKNAIIGSQQSIVQVAHLLCV